MLRQFFRESRVEPPESESKAMSVTINDLRKASFLASVLSSSPKDKHKEKAMSLAILAYLDNPNQLFSSLCYIILSRTDNIQQGKHLTKFLENGHFLIKFDEVLNLEIAANRALARLEFEEEYENPIYLSLFQKQLWSELKKNNRLMAISGPTSSGKSFIVQTHIVQLCKENDVFKALYIVPTRALISEVSSDLRKKLSDVNVSIKVAIGENDEATDREVFVVTPERCLQLLRNSINPRKIDFIFVDEIQKIEDNERGVLYEHVLSELLRTQPEAKVIIAGPYLKNLEKTLKRLTGLTGKIVESELSPVYQLKTILSVTKKQRNKIAVDLIRGVGEKTGTSFFTKKSLYSPLKSHPISTVSRIALLYGKDSTNIIYAPGKRTAEKCASALAKISKNQEIKKERLNELIDYLSKEIHSDYSLIRCLRNGVAFHHGMVPEIAKLEVEDLYRNGSIRNLVCTTTLLEGVNLPADRLFIYRPYKGTSDNPLDNFDFGNLAGRAGRASSKLNGSIYCIELADEPWAEAKLNSDPKKEVVPTTERATTGTRKNDLLENVSKPSTDIQADLSVIQTIIFLRQKALIEPLKLDSYLLSKRLSEDEISSIKEGILASVNNLLIPTDLVRLNPTIDPMLQDRLYRLMSEEGVENWGIDKFPVRSGGARWANDFEDKNFYGQFEEIAVKLNDIFDFVNNIKKKQKSYYRSSRTVRSIAYYGVTWIEQRPLSYVIKKELKRNDEEPQENEKKTRKSQRKRKAKESEKIDKIVLEVSDHIENDVRFELVKYFKLWADIIGSLLITDEQKEKYGHNLSLPLMLELGAYNPHVINMIRSGINRSVAIEASNYLPTDFKGDAIPWLMKNAFDRLSPIFQRHLKNLGFKPMSNETK